MREIIDNKIIVRQFIEQVVNRGNLDAIEKFVAKNIVDHNLPPGVPQGIEAYKQHLATAWQLRSDLYLSVKSQIVQGDWVVTRLTITGTYQNERSGPQSDGQKITLSSINMDRVVNGKIIEHWGEANTQTCLFEWGTKAAWAEAIH